MKSIERLLTIMRILRDPERGCPWDRQQTVESILPYTLEEVYELADAVDQGSGQALCDELGDLLFHVVYYARIMEERGEFDFNDVVRSVAEKLERRHPHVFADETAGTPEQVAKSWERIKAQERGKNSGGASGTMDGVSRNMPALSVAGKIQKRAAGVGFDWDKAEQVLDKIQEEIEEIRVELERDGNKQRVMEETGDLFFACVNFARHAGIDPEIALRKANDKFIERFRFMENELAKRGKTPDAATMDEMEALWIKSKTAGK